MSVYFYVLALAAIPAVFCVPTVVDPRILLASQLFADLPIAAAVNPVAVAVAVASLLLMAFPLQLASPILLHSLCLLCSPALCVTTVIGVPAVMCHPCCNWRRCCCRLAFHRFASIPATAGYPNVADVTSVP